VKRKHLHGKPEPGDVASKIAATTNRRKQVTAEPIASAKVATLEPEFCRPADCRNLFGLSRTFVYQLIQGGKIKSVCLRKPGAATGIRLLHVASIREFLTSQLEASNP
jgi:hypothetical protein